MGEIIYLNEVPYNLVRQIRETQVGTNMEGLKAWRDFLHCDHVLKYQGNYLMVRIIEEAEIIEE